MMGFKFNILACMALLLMGCISLSKSASLDRVKREVAEIQSSDCTTADLVILLDSSGSIGADNWLRVLNFTQEVARSFTIGEDKVRIGVGYFGNHGKVGFHLNQYDNEEDVLAAIAEIPWKNQNTNTASGLRVMHSEMFTEENGDRAGVMNIGILLSDGQATKEVNRTIPEAILARESGITIFGIGIGDDVDPEELRNIASVPSEQFTFNVTGFDALDHIRGQVSEAACIVASECTENADFSFLIDSSRNVGSRNFEHVKEFASTLMYEINLDNGASRVGLMTYSEEPTVHAELGEYDTREEMADLVRELNYEGGNTDTSLALKMAREYLYSNRNGNRPDVNDVIVLVTNGRSRNFHETLQEAVLTKLAGITIIVVAVSDRYNEFEVKEMASDPDMYNVFSMSTVDDVRDLVTPVRQAMCNDYNECSANPCTNGGTCYNLINAYECSCPVGFAGKHCDVECREPADVVIALDSSGSVGVSRYSKLLEFTKNIVHNLNIGTGSDSSRIGLETYASDALVRYNLDTFTTRRDAVNAISFIYMDGSTATGNALSEMRQMFDGSVGDRNGVRNVGLVISDGHSNDRHLTQHEAQLTRADGVTLLSIGVGMKTHYDEDEMRYMASPNEAENYMVLEDLNNYNNFTLRVLDAVCNNVDECADNPCQGGGECVEMINHYECRCPDGRTGANCERRCSGEIDLVFVIDTSGSIRRRRWPLVQQFVKDVISKMEVGLNRARIGVITYADDAIFRFSLDQYSSKKDILTAIDRLPYTGGKTNTADALEMLTTDMFTFGSGDRDDVDNVAIIVSDGQSNINPENTIPQAIRARVNGIHLAVATMENDPNNLELKGIASDPDEENIFNVRRYSQMGDMVDSIVGITCDDVNECVADPCENGGECIDLRNTYMCMCEDDFTGPDCERRCQRQKDIVFLLDASGSVDDNFALIQELTKRIVSGLNFAIDRTRVGIVTYQDTEQVRFNLDEYTFKDEVINAIAFDQSRSKGTHTSSALRTMREDMFTNSNGDRNGVDNVAIVITDGRSNIQEDNTIPEAELAKDEDIRVMTVGVGRRVGISEINGMASTPSSDNTFLLVNESDMNEVADLILDQLCES